MNPFTVKLLGWTPGIIGMLVLSFISQQPGNVLPPPLFAWSDKLYHFLAYGILSVLFILRLPLSGKLPAGKGISHPWTILLGCSHAILNEYHQLLVPLREFSYFDMAANLLGFLSIYAVAYKISARQFKTMGGTSHS